MSMSNRIEFVFFVSTIGNYDEVTLEMPWENFLIAYSSIFPW
jgi:hypothetical protein